MCQNVILTLNLSDNCSISYTSPQESIILENMITVTNKYPVGICFSNSHLWLLYICDGLNNSASLCF